MEVKTKFVEEWTTTSQVFKHPFTSMIVGPTQSGKTCLIKSILSNINYLISCKNDAHIERIIYCYSAWQTIYDELQQQIKPKIEFVQGFLDLDILDPIQNNLIILDDLMSDKTIQFLNSLQSIHITKTRLFF